MAQTGQTARSPIVAGLPGSGVVVAMITMPLVAEEDTADCAVTVDALVALLDRLDNDADDDSLELSEVVEAVVCVLGCVVVASDVEIVVGVADVVGVGDVVGSLELCDSSFVGSVSENEINDESEEIDDSLCAGARSGDWRGAGK